MSFTKHLFASEAINNMFKGFNSLQEKLSFVTWFMIKLLVMENIYDYMTM
jgi:hypothetical protein